ncbi:hypothetical protein ACI2OX_13260 [Bacillus sp. N9]
MELESLKETVVEMQVQNRVVIVNVMNHSPMLKQVAQSFIPALKDQLLQLNYQLSAVHFKPFANNANNPIQKTYERGNSAYHGVDIRI